MTLHVNHPTAMAVSGVAWCEVHTLTDELSVAGSLGEAPFDRPGTIGVYLTAGLSIDDDPTARDDGLALSILVENFDTNAGVPEVGSTRDSTLQLRRDGMGGTLRFAELHSTERASGPTWLNSPDLEGTVEWSWRGD